MKIYSVYDEQFRPYGKVLEGYDTAELLKAMNEIPMPETGVAYQPAIASLEDCAIFPELSVKAYGGMPIQLGMCWGHNTKLNCLEYHRDSELNIGQLLRSSGYAEDYIRAQFKKITGKTPGRFLTEIRIKHACYMMEAYGSVLTLNEIAEKCGYTDYVYFSKRFKEITGSTPRHYTKTE